MSDHDVASSHALGTDSMPLIHTDVAV